MPFFDFNPEELAKYRPDTGEKPDFDAFWKRTMDKTRSFPLNAEFKPYDCGLSLIEHFDVTFSGYNGQRIKGWLGLPKGVQGKLPCVVEFIGYGGGRGTPLDWLLWPSAGYAHLVMDSRGQGSTWRQGDTPDIEDLPGSPQVPGFMTKGILDPESYYYKRLFADAARAVEAARANPRVDPARVAVTGGSQGGGLTIAAAALAEVQAAMPDVPFLCDFRRATRIVETYPYEEIAIFCRNHRDRHEQVFSTLSYFDGVSLAARAKAPSLFSVGLMDATCPPSTVYAAFNRWAGPKEIAVYEFNHHEGGQGRQDLRKLAFLKKLWG